jgi:hypothetical protein
MAVVPLLNQFLERVAGALDALIVTGIAGSLKLALQAQMFNSCFGRTHGNSLHILNTVCGASCRHVEPDVNGLWRRFRLVSVSMLAQALFSF